MKRVRWHKAARGDLDGIAHHFAERDPRIAVLLIRRIEAAVVGLAQRDTGRPGRMPQIREKSVPRTPYVIAYEVLEAEDGAGIRIHRVIHGARDWKSAAWPRDD